MKTLQDIKKIRKQVSRKSEEIRGFKSVSTGVPSWSKYVRQGLGMSLSQMARRLGVAQSTMSESEKQETEGRITLNKLRKMAEALDCDLVYAFVPREKLEDLVLRQARKKALKSMSLAETHMDLEDQRVLIDKEERLKDIIEEKMYSKYLWDEDD